MKRFLSLCFLFIGIFLMSVVAHSAEKTVAWDASPGDVQGYRISISTDGGLTWTQAADVAPTVLETIVTVSDTGLTLIRASAYNNIGESVGTTSGVWFNPLWEIASKPSSLRSPGE